MTEPDIKLPKLPPELLMLLAAGFLFGFTATVVISMAKRDAELAEEVRQTMTEVKERQELALASLQFKSGNTSNGKTVNAHVAEEAV